MLRERANAQARQLGGLCRRTLRPAGTAVYHPPRTGYLRLAEDPPEHPARPPCTLKNWWSTAPPYNTRPAAAGEARAGPRPVRRFAAKGGDG